MKRLSTSALATLALATTPLVAQDDAQREMGAHVHGISTLELAVEGNALEMNLLSPGMDIVGFEYVAESEADKDAVEAAIRTMLMPENIVTLPEAAECRLTEVLAHLHAGDHDHDDMDEHAEGEAHDHDHDHAEGEDHDHDHEAHAEGEDHDHDHEEHAEGEDHDHDHADGAVHSEFHASYAFDCAHPEELTTVAFPFFAAFENAQEIEAEFVTEAGAGAAEIGRDRPELALQ
ncbi:DUF2796 domain-containing protein [uncultured Maritimibacter sp.]|jgi:hypothetical protein|uniref:zinc uptake protein ZrgA n=1 Tax=uncultured Maritimibacter sp. TaxID=991866 RepID=UPI00261FFE23|nr:DUF2796 domain-containing protein [uncultured Maritimibacter sp.]